MGQSKLIAIVGPTGTGKSNLALTVAESLSQRGQIAEVINCDSMQFYRGMDIGTAKLRPEERRGVEHHLFDWLEVTDESTAAAFQPIARAKIQEIQSRGNTPILVGGSMLYLAAVLNTFEFPARDEQLRAELETQLLELGTHEMHRRLAELDPIAASRIIPENGRRVVRAIEIIKLTGAPFAAALPEPESWQPVLEIGLNSDREHLTARLASRVHKMWLDGLLEEVRGLEVSGLRHGKTASRAIGYAQALAQLDGDKTEADAIAETVQLTNRYARRQMSWFRRDPRIRWFDYQDPEHVTNAFALVNSWLKL